MKRLVHLFFITLLCAGGYVSYHTINSLSTTADYRVQFAGIAAEYDTGNPPAETDSTGPDTTKTETHDGSTYITSPLPPDKEVYVAKIDNFVPVLFIIALAFIFYYAKSKKGKKD